MADDLGLVPAEQDPVAPASTPPSPQNDLGLTPVPEAPVQHETDMSDVKSWMMDKLKSFQGTPTDSPHAAFKQVMTHVFESPALKSGFQHSVEGLKDRGKLPDADLDSNADWGTRALFNVGQLAGDVPSMVEGGVVGGAMAGPLGAAAGAFAAPAALRKIYMDKLQKGDVKDPSDFMQRVMGTAWEATKGAVTGVAAEATGGVAGELLGPAADFAAKLGTMTVDGKLLEGQMPKMQDILDAAILMGGVHIAGTIPKLMDIYSKTGAQPHEVVDAANKDVSLKQEILSTATDKPDVPPPTEPTEVTNSEGTTETKHLVNPMFDQEVEEARQEQVRQNQQANSTIERTPEEQEVLSKIGQKPEVAPKTVKEIAQNWYANNFDYTSNLKRAIEQVQDVKGSEPLSDSDNSWISTRLFAAHNDKVASFFTDGTRDAETDKVNGESLNKIYSEVPDNDQLGLDAYAMAKQGLAMDAKGQTPWADFNRENAQKIVDAGKDKFDDLNSRRVDFQNRVLEYGMKKGLYSEDSFNRMVKAGEDSYLPLHRIQEPDEFTGETKGSGSAIPKKRFGSEQQVVNPRESVYKNTEMILRKADINEIRQQALENLTLTEEDGTTSNDFLQKVKADQKPITVQKEELQKYLGGDSDIPPEALTIFRPERSYLSDNQIPIWQDGKMSVYEGDPGVVSTLKKLEGDKTSMDVTTKFMSGFNKALRLGTTSDIGFGIRHAFRTAFMSGVYTQTGQIPFIHPLMALGEFMKGESGTYKNWLYDGGAVRSWNELGENYIKNDLQGSDAKYPFLNQAWNVIKTPIEASEAFIKLTDNLSRFTEYKRALEQGKDRTEAAFLSREVTPDAQKMGLQRSIIRTGTAFLGAHLNSLDRMQQAFTEDPKGTMAKLSVIAAMSAMTWAVNRKDEDIQSLPDYKKDLYWNVNLTHMTGTGNETSGMIIRFPKPWAPGIIFGSGIERTLDAFVNDNPHAYDGFGKSVFDSVVPNILPTMAEPILDQYANKNRFTGQLLVDEKHQKMLPEMQYGPNTSETAKQMAKLIGYVPMVRDIGPSSDPLASPAVVEDYVRGWTGTMGGWFLKLGDYALREAGVTPSNIGKTSTDTLADAPILSEFLTRFPSMKTQDVTNFYSNLDHTTKVLNTIRAEEKSGSLSAAMQLSQAQPDMEVHLNGIAEAISTAKKGIQYVQDNPTIPAMKKRELVDTLLFQIGSSAKMGNQMMDQFHKNLKGKE